MSQEIVEVIRRGMEYFKRAGEWLWDVIDPEIEIHDHDVPDGNVVVGHAGWLRWETTFESAWEPRGELQERQITTRLRRGRA